MSEVLILKKRKDFVRVAAKGVKVATSTLILQAAQSLSSPARDVLEDGCYLGFTATKKLGKAHVRNRVKRRLRAAAAECFVAGGRPGTDYVLIGRYNTAVVDFAKLKSDMARALLDINSQMDSQGAQRNETPDDRAD